MKKILLTLMLLPLMSCWAWSQEDSSIEYEDEKSDVFTPLSTTPAMFNKYILGNGFTFSSTDQSTAMTLSGLIQTNMFVQKFPDDDDLYVRWRMRRVRTRLQGIGMGGKIRYRLEVDLVKGSEVDGEAGFLLQDAWIQYRPWGNKLMITMGQSGTPTDNRELSIGSQSLLLVERSRLSSLYGTIRELGIYLSGSYKVGANSYIRPSIAITDGNGPISIGPRYGGLKYGARVNYLPFGLFRLFGEGRGDDLAYELSPKLSVGAAYSYNVGVTDRRGREVGTLLYFDDKNNIVLPDYAKLVADFMFKYQGWTLMGEYAKSWAYISSSITQRLVDGVPSNRLPSAYPDFNTYIRSQMILGSTINIQGGYTTRNFWTVSSRYTYVIPDKNSWLNNTLYYDRNTSWEFGITRYLTKSYASKIQATFGMIKANGDARYRQSAGSDDIYFRGWEKNFNIMFQLAF